MRIAVDCGNGVPGAFAPALFRRLGCDVEELFCEVDGNFPNHHPDPSQPENLKDLIAALKKGNAEIGLAFDGDGDRLGVVTKQGKIIFPDRQLMLFAADVLKRNPGAEILFDVKCTRNLAPWIRNHGGRPTMWKTGHSLIKAKMKETGALLAGEMSGHVFFKERWYGFDDGAYAGARLLEILSGVADIGEAFNSLPDSINTPELQIKLGEGENYALIEKLAEDREISDGARGHHDGRAAGRIRGRFRPGTLVEHHAGGGAALRSRRRSRTQAHPGRFPAGAAPRRPHRPASVLTHGLSSGPSFRGSS